jgi:hypothetical protein
VNSQRYSSSLWSRHMLNALGSYSSLYMAAVFGYFGHYTGLFKMAPIATPIVSSAGILSVARNVSIAAAPAVLGLTAGCLLFGEFSQVKSLLWNFNVYRREFRCIKNELYYM